MLEIHGLTASIGDKEFIISLVPRLVEFGPPSWRNGSEMIATDQQVLTDKLLNQPPGTAIFSTAIARARFTRPARRNVRYARHAGARPA